MGFIEVNKEEAEALRNGFKEGKYGEAKALVQKSIQERSGCSLSKAAEIFNRYERGNYVSPDGELLRVEDIIVTEAEMDLVRNGKKLLAIKSIREREGVSLPQAMDIVNGL